MEAKLLQDFLNANNLEIQQGDFIVKKVEDGSAVIISKPIVTVAKKAGSPAPAKVPEAPPEPAVEGESIPNES